MAVSQPMKNLEPVEVGHMEVEQDDVRSLLRPDGRKITESLGTVMAADNGLGESGVAKKYFADRRIIVVVFDMADPE